LGGDAFGLAALFLFSLSMHVKPMKMGWPRCVQFRKSGDWEVLLCLG
jgi:hypothetical protein